MFSYCYTNDTSSLYHLVSFDVINVPFVLPLCVYILYLGVQRWRSRVQISHTDFFTFNVAFIQIIVIFASCLLIVNYSLHSEHVLKVSYYASFTVMSAVIFFQIFTCLERYAAVVHPVAYLSLKSQTWILIRNSSCAFVWLQCVIFATALGAQLDIIKYIIISLTCLTFCIALVLFCNLRVLYVLMRPGPGDGAKGSQVKLKALYTITAVTGALLVKFGGDVAAIGSLGVLIPEDSCGLFLSVFWFSFPNSLVLPLLFLHRKGKLHCFKTK
ncbi:hypothetical protein NQD34_013381 [Periophthalmus magnuspinnatus]|nr:hypothetical protein NQD34_013381 [Periophthalmus magnuspinnatus]